MDKKYEVFVSSTYTDLKEERQKVFETLLRCNCIPAGMEQFPSTNEDQWSFIERKITACDFYLLILGSRYGTPMEDGNSYTENEYHYAKSINKPIISFIRKDINTLSNDLHEKDQELVKKLDAFRDEACKGRLVTFWANKDELATHVLTAIYEQIRIGTSTGWVRADTISNSESLKRIIELQDENTKLQNQLSSLQPIQREPDLDKIITIKFTTGNKIAPNKFFKDEYYKFNIQLKKIFEISSGVFINYPTTINVIELIESCFAKDFSHLNTKGFGVFTIYLEQESKELILLNLETEGLIQLSDNKDIWFLTELGKKMYTSKLEKL